MIKFCDSPWTTINIGGNGDVGLCLCNRWAIKRKNIIGNLLKTSLKSMFRTGQVQEFRETILDQSYRHCDINVCGKIWNLPQIESFDVIKSYPSLPTHIMLTIDSTCNLSCASCRLQNNYSPKINLGAQQILQFIKESYKDFNHPVLIQGDGAGDVLNSAAYIEFFNSDNMPECFQFALLTNGTLLSKNLELIQKLRKQISVLTVSLDAATIKTYKRIRGADLNIVLDGIRAVLNMKIPVTTQFVLQRENYQEVLAYRDLCLELGVTHMGIQKLVRWPHMTDHWWKYNNVDTNTDIDYNQLVNDLEQFKLEHIAGVDGGIYTIINQYRSNSNI